MKTVRVYFQPILSLIAIIIGLAIFISPLRSAALTAKKSNAEISERKFIVDALEERLMRAHNEIAQRQRKIGISVSTSIPSAKRQASDLGERCQTFEQTVRAKGVNLTTNCRITNSPLSDNYSLIAAHFSATGPLKSILSAVNDLARDDLAIAHFHVEADDAEPAAKEGRFEIRIFNLAHDESPSS